LFCESFWDYLGHRHNIRRAREGKPVMPKYTSEQSASMVKQIEQAHPEYKAIGDDIVKHINDFMEEWGHKSGLIDDDTWKKLRETYPDYFPTNRVFENESELANIFTDYRGTTSPLKTATGSDRDINPVENIMNLINTTVRKARINQVGQSFAEAIRETPEKFKGVAEILKHDPGADNVLKVFENGKPIYIRIRDMDLLESFKDLGTYSDDALEKFGKKLTGWFKTVTTGKNPIFTLKNFFRDFPTSYINGSEKNPVKFVKEHVEAFKDLKNNTDIAQQFKALGGSTSNFSFDSKNVAKSVDDMMKRGNVLQKLDDINNIVESTPRLAEFKRTLEKTNDIDKALKASKDITVDFSRSGKVAKKIDAFAPYFNASVQGLDKLARSLDPRNPKQLMQTLAKGGLGIALPSLALHLANKNNPNYQKLDDRTKDTYYLIPTGDTFLKVPKSRELGVIFGVLTERTMRTLEGDSQAFKGLGGFKGTIANNIGPVNPISDNIFSPLLGISANKDFADRTIVPQSMQDRSAANQYDEQTTEIAKGLGKVLNMSPKQIDYLIKSYTGIIGQIVQPATTKINYQGNNLLSKITKPFTTSFTADPLYSNSSVTDFYDNYDKLKQKAADKNFEENVPSKTVTREEELRNKFAKYSKEMSDLNKEIRQAEAEGNTSRIRSLRLKIIMLAEEANELIK
jgi:hypothetical protein